MIRLGDMGADAPWPTDHQGNPLIRMPDGTMATRAVADAYYASLPPSAPLTPFQKWWAGGNIGGRGIEIVGLALVLGLGYAAYRWSR